MRIGFVNNGKGNPAMGSYRIWVANLYQIWLDHGYDVTHERRPNADVLIFPKGGEGVATLYKKDNPKAVIGVINPKLVETNLDFCIVGSIEERDSALAFYRNAFIYPLIERKYRKWKTHVDRSPLCIGYHGNSIHVNNFDPHLGAIGSALEMFAKQLSIRLLVITDSRWKTQWVAERPRGIPIDVEIWNTDTVEDRLLDIDIGIAPNCDVGISATTPSWSQHLEPKVINWENDYVLRFKSRSNPGRSFVFHQLGIPVIADFTPSHFHIMGNPDCGVLAHSRAGWVDGLNRLRAANVRTTIARNAYRRFRELYDPIKHAVDLHNKLLEMFLDLTK